VQRASLIIVLVPTRDDVLAIRSVEEAFDLSTRKVRKREVALIRVAASEGLLELTEHAAIEADDESIPYGAVKSVVSRGKAASKDTDDAGGDRQIGINFEGSIPDRRRVRTKVAWQDGYLVVTVHTIGMVY
jgi:hypothetical protein